MTVLHLVVALPQSYVDEGITVNTGPPWLRGALEDSIKKCPYASKCTPEMVEFIQWDMQWRVQDRFKILLPAASTLILFGQRLKLSRIAAVPKAYRQPGLILSLSAQPNKVTPKVTRSVNDTMDR